jgi:hypothetical protein
VQANKTSVVENLSNELEIVLTRVFDAPREMVFDACADASAAARDFVIRNYHAVEGGKQTLQRLAEFVAEKGVAA